MTINIALVTYDGIVLGCDSLSSVIDHAIFPFQSGIERAKGADGNPLTDAHGNPMIALAPQHLVPVASTVFGGVNKIFSLYEDDDTCVAAVTSGMATIVGVTISEQAKRYRRERKQAGTDFDSVKDVADDFKRYFRELWERQFEGVPPEQRTFLPSIQFIVAGFGANDEHGQVFKVDVARDTITEQFEAGDHMGICWSGQSDYVERLMLGVDGQLAFTASRQMAEAMAKQRESVISDVSDALVKGGVKLPEGLDIQVTEHTPPTLPWDTGRADIDFGNLSTQYAVELAEMLVNTQSGMQRFARGIPTVGGRTHIGVLKRGDGFVLLNEPELQHRHTGYAHDY